MHARFWFIVTLHGLVVPVQPHEAPLQPVNVPVVDTVNCGTAAPNVQLQVPVVQGVVPTTGAGELATVPVPTMVMAMVAVYVKALAFVPF